MGRFKGLGEMDVDELAEITLNLRHGFLNV